ncbi:MAG: hypothetical protein CO186_04770 [Zetaproteobacteria bacterium CG_4_9_14_3_um_filter_49_83]|nr:MAG: hypothetical protein COW62_09655 [Zetaproteobacteria bacterium CG17_big_fil_post_rev_8_21_14_2_50_50_13]PIV29689.1 MAG: hypothetical protein COS35_10715 [Zetaproteobacteria bacterium CG02_land_8_20_14_3_00_50_9]PIY54603.1 MAG: hypothetical protein COZ00_13710 [Zetaproteobacteria bacterium CG_4_10_14_0_8_um_filter_49_80]PJA35668.1 MAG: hypothetical protein CO186_04770 [Zetaproteobacteria bacterium CG_4_9_14_3_um_filter_49_83]
MQYKGMFLIRAFFRVFAGLLLFSIILATAAWFSAPWWLSRLAQHELERAGFYQVMLEIESIGLQQSRIRRLHLRQQQGAVEIDSEQVMISYSLNGLLDQHIDSLKLERLDITLHPSQKQSESPLTLVSPAALFSQIPASSIELEHITLRQLAANGDTLQALSGQASYHDQTLQMSLRETGNSRGLQAELSLDAQGQCKVQISRNDVDILRGQCLISEQQADMQLQGSLQADLAALDALAISWLDMPAHKINGEMQLAWTASLPSTADAEQWQQALTFNAEVELNTALEYQPQSYAAALKASASYALGKLAWKIDDQSKLRFGDHLHSALSFASFAGNLDQLTPLHLTLNKGSQLQLQQFSSSDITIPKLNFKILSPLQISHEHASVQLVRATDIAVNTGTLQWQDKNLRSQNMRIKLKAGKLFTPAGSIRIDGFDVQSDKMTLPMPLNLAAEFDLSRDPLNVRGSLASADEMLHVDWRLSHSFNKASGTLDYTLKPLQPAALPVLVRMLGDRDSVGISSGTLNSQGQLQWNQRQALTASIELALEEMNGFYQKTTFSGLTSSIHLALNEQALLLSSDKLTVHSLDASLPITDVSMNAVINNPFQGPVSVQLNDVQAQALGGQISSPRIDIEMGRKSNPFMISLAKIDAGQLAEFRKQEGFTAEGKLNGTLPFDWTDKGLKMTAGKLTSREPGGVIRYLGTPSMQQLAASDTATHMAMQILSDFRFSLLQINADYQPEGDLFLQIGIKGHNPAYENGRRIEFNFNIEENVLKLLQSLRMADEISGRIEKKVKVNKFR